MASKFNFGKRLRVSGHEYRKMDYGAALRCGCSCKNRFVSKRWHPSFNPRTAGGQLYAPSGFSQIAKKRRGTRRQICHSCSAFSQQFGTFGQKMMTRWPQRSRLQVTLSDLTSSCIFQSLRVCQRYIEDPNSLKLAVCKTDIGIYDFYVSDSFIPVTSGHVIFMTSPL